MRKHLLSAIGCLALVGLLQTESVAQVKGPSSSQTPYVLPSAAGVQTTSLLTVPDVAGGYKMVGLPDGLGAFDNGNGTFTLLMNHEIGATSGAVRAHGVKGAFVSKWIINKSNLSIVNGSDLIQTVKLWDKNTNSYITYNASTPQPTPFGRFCSADLPAVSAFYNKATGKGTQERIFMNGEETGTEGRGVGHIATGSSAGISYELPAIGKFSWENSVASPYESDKTVVVGLDDATPGQVYFYIGTKTNTGTEIEKAGLTNGILYGVTVQGMLLETSATAPTAAFSLTSLGNVTNLTGAQLQTASNNAGITQFLRPEDGAWDPLHPEDFYFVTTNAFNSPSRLWKLHFNNVNDLTQGGTISAVLNGIEGQQMLDNIAIDHWGHILMQEDVGGNVRLGKTWQYTIATHELKEIATHDATRFISGAANYIGTQDEEASGIIDVQEILGAGMFMIVDQAHYGIAGDAVEGGQMLAMYNPDTYNACAAYTGNISVSPSPTVINQTPNTIFIGYGPQSVMLTAAPDVLAFPPYTYSWSNGGTTNAITVSPTTTTTYTVTIKNAFGCAITVDQTITVKDIRDGDKNKVFICHNGHSQSVSVNAIPAFLAQGDQLGKCENEAGSERLNTGLQKSALQSATLYPNPARNTATVSLSLSGDEKVSVSVVDIQGRTVIAAVQQNMKAGKQLLELNISRLTKGTYFVQVTSGGNTTKLKMAIIR
jgi:hypothetical protein